MVSFKFLLLVVIRQQLGGMCKKLSLLLFIVLFNHDLITTYDFLCDLTRVFEKNIIIRLRLSYLDKFETSQSRSQYITFDTVFKSTRKRIEIKILVSSQPYYNIM